MKLLKELLNIIYKNQKDNCVLCESETKYSKNTNVNERYFYIEGCGQLCARCYSDLYY